MVAAILLKCICGTLSLFYRETFGYERIFSWHQRVDKTSCKNQYVLTDIGMISYRRYQTLTFIVRFIDIYVWWQLWLVLRIESIIDALSNFLHVIMSDADKFLSLCIICLIVKSG